jgi:hypothetical protein|tara:strand:- start:67 stop:369 length:303 start_codon:yes stop_codon:yes gene_type:complete
MAIQATVDLGNGISASAAYLIIPAAYVKKYDDDSFSLIYDVLIYQNADGRATNLQSKQIKCRTVDHHKVTYNPASGEQNAFKLAYADLKTNGSLSSISDA